MSQCILKNEIINPTTLEQIIVVRQNEAEEERSSVDTLSKRSFSSVTLRFAINHKNLTEAAKPNIKKHTLVHQDYSLLVVFLLFIKYSICLFNQESRDIVLLILINAFVMLLFFD